MNALKKTQEDLQKGRQKLDDMLQRLEREQVGLDFIDVECAEKKSIVLQLNDFCITGELFWSHSNSSPVCITCLSGPSERPIEMGAKKLPVKMGSAS